MLTNKPLEMKNPQRFIKWIVGVSILIILLAPFVLTRPSFETLSFLKTGQIGDTIGGISSPIVGIVSIFLLAYTLIEQLDLDIKQKIDFVYGRFFNIHEECGNYFRHLYRILYFVKQAEEEELLGIYDVAVRQQVSKRYYDLVQFVQAQMSTKEMLMVFYNSFSFPKLRELLIRYNLLENLTVENLIAPSHNCIDGYHLKKQLI